MTEAESDVRAVQPDRRTALSAYELLFDQGYQCFHLVAPANDRVASALSASVSNLLDETAEAAE